MYIPPPRIVQNEVIKIDNFSNLGINSANPEDVAQFLQDALAKVNEQEIIDNYHFNTKYKNNSLTDIFDKKDFRKENKAHKYIEEKYIVIKEEKDNIENDNDIANNEIVKNEVKETAKNSKKEISAEEKQDDVINLVFQGAVIKDIQCYGMTIRMRVISVAETDKALHQANFYASEWSFQLAAELFVLAQAIESIDQVMFFDSDECLKYLQKLAIPVINELYSLYRDQLMYQNSLIQDLNNFSSLVNHYFSRIKYKVMRALGCLPTEDRCKQMNDAQWLWYFFNLEEDLYEDNDRMQDNLDYLGIYMNPKLAQELIQKNLADRKKRNKQRKEHYSNIYEDKEQPKNVSKEEALLDEYYHNTPVTKDNTFYNSDFDRELAEAMKGVSKEDIAEISDDNSAGNPYESEEDFLKRALFFLPLGEDAIQINQKQQQQAILNEQSENEIQSNTENKYKVEEKDGMISIGPVDPDSEIDYIVDDE